VGAFFGYDWIMQQMTSNIRYSLVATPESGLFQHLLITSTAFAFIGFSIGISTWICKRYLWLFTLVATISSVGWFLYLSNRVSNLVEKAGQGLTNVSFPISVMPLYEVGLFAGACVLSVAFAMVILQKLIHRDEHARSPGNAPN
jgi:hypothetical protein